MERLYITINGHAMTMTPEFEMGGGISGITLYCWTCSPTGNSHIGQWDFWDWGDGKVYTKNEALLEMRKTAWKHSHPERIRK